MLGFLFSPCGLKWKLLAQGGIWDVMEQSCMLLSQYWWIQLKLLPLPEFWFFLWNLEKVLWSSGQQWNSLAPLGRTDNRLIEKQLGAEEWKPCEEFHLSLENFLAAPPQVSNVPCPPSDWLQMSCLINFLIKVLHDWFQATLFWACPASKGGGECSCLQPCALSVNAKLPSLFRGSRFNSKNIFSFLFWMSGTDILMP